MSAAAQFHVSEVSQSYWRVTFENGPVNLLDPVTIDQLGALPVRLAHRRGSYDDCAQRAWASFCAIVVASSLAKSVGGVGVSVDCPQTRYTCTARPERSTRTRKIPGTRSAPRNSWPPTNKASSPIGSASDAQTVVSPLARSCRLHLRSAVRISETDALAERKKRYTTSRDAFHRLGPTRTSWRPSTRFLSPGRRLPQRVSIGGRSAPSLRTQYTSGWLNGTRAVSSWGRNPSGITR